MSQEKKWIKIPSASRWQDPTEIFDDPDEDQVVEMDEASLTSRRWGHPETSQVSVDFSTGNWLMPQKSRHENCLDTSFK